MNIVRSKSLLIPQKITCLALHGMYMEELISMGRKLRVEIATLCDNLKGSASSREKDVSFNLQSELSYFDSSPVYFCHSLSHCND